MASVCHLIGDGSKETFLLGWMPRVDVLGSGTYTRTNKRLAMMQAGQTMTRSPTGTFIHEGTADFVDR